MNRTPSLDSPRRTTTMIALGLVALLATGCPGFEAPWAESSQTQAGDASSEPSAEELALERRLAEAEAAEAAAAEAAERALAEREEVLRLREEQLEKEQALRREQERLARAKAEAETRQRQLAAKEKELENYEANLEFQEKELSDRETLIEETLEAMEVPTDSSEPAGSSSPASTVESSDSELFVNDSLPESPAASDRPVVASLEPGRLLEIEFEETVSSATHRRGDEFAGRLVQDLTAEDGTLVVPAGAQVVGRVIEAVPPKRVGGRALLEVEFTHLVLASGDQVAISASFVEVGADRRKDKKRIAGAAIVGAILGRVLGDGTEGVLAGAAAGAAAGTIAVSRGEGKEAEIPEGQIVALQLDEVVTVEIEMTGPVEP